MKSHDFLIVGAGLFGAVFAHEMAKIGKKCLVIDKRNHNGGNTYCENVAGINVHAYGAHIFHTNDESIWNYVNSFVKFNRYTNSPLAIYQDCLYNLPFNMNTFHQLWGVKTPEEAKQIIARQTAVLKGVVPQNLEEQALSMVGKDIYEKLIKGYTEKQWGRDAIELPPFIIKRLPLRFTYDNNYFDDKFQGIPIGGYNVLINNLLKGIEVKLNIDYLLNREYLDSLAERIVYTGRIDEFYLYKLGKLEYRSLRFEHDHIDVKNFQGNAVVNYTEKRIPYTRIIEHKHFEFGDQDSTVITKEFPETYQQGKEPYYPINDSKNNNLYQEYSKLNGMSSKIIFGGRLAEFKYYDMHQIIASALKKVDKVKQEIFV